jgi:RNA polymerase sigma-70 factor (ECF subfamily)
MEQAPLGTKENIETMLEKYSDMVRRICFLYLQNSADVDDVFQDVFLKILKKKTPFESCEHERAWLTVATINRCKDVLKSFWRKNTVTIEGMEVSFEDKAESELMEVVISLPKKYKEVIYLYYYEGYTVPEIAMLLHKNENSIYSQLHRARLLIKQKLRGKEHEYSFSICIKSN